MRRFGRRLKSFTAVLLSACLVFPLGAVNSWAEEPEYPAAAAAVEAVAEAVAGSEAAAAEETILPDVIAEAAAEAAVEAVQGADAAEAAAETAAEEGAEAGSDVAVEEAFYAEAETASASDAINAAEEEQGVTAGAENESEAATSTASASDAQFDEDGFLLDGEVVDDVEEEPELTDEIIAPEMITEVIGKKEAGPPAWLMDYEYDTDNTNMIITLKKYKGDDAEIYVPATAKVVGDTYDIAIGQAQSYRSNWAGNYVRSISFEDGVRMPANMTAMFAGCGQLRSVDLSNLNTSYVTSMREMFKECWNLTSLDLRNLDTSSVTEMREMFSSCIRLEEIKFGTDSGPDTSKFSTSKVKDMAFMFYNCEALEQLDLSVFNMSKVTSGYRMFYDSYSIELIRTPRYCDYDVELPCQMQDRGGTTYNMLPKGKSYSFELADPDKYVFVTSINLNTTMRTLAKGSKFQLKAWPQPVNATNKVVRWVSYMDSVATVDSNGLVTAVDEGYALICCESRDFDGPTAYCEIMVGTPVTGIVINTTAKSLEVGETFQVKGWAKPNNATNRTVLYSSDNPAVAAVDEAGFVTALKGGTAIITAKTQDHGYTATCKITVNLHVTGVKINTTARTIEAGKTFQMAAWPQPSNATNKAVTWTSSNPAVAKVSSTGLVTGVKNGTANITVTTADGGYKATCKITVGIPVTSLVINTTARTILAGKTFKLAAWPQPANASNRAVTWISNNPAIATVNSSGLVTGVKDGYAVITVKTVDGGYTKTCAITVGIPVTSVVINTKAKTMNVGKTFKLAAWPQPTNASNRAVTWTSSNTSVATVSATGLVTAKKKGTATITVKTVDAGYTETCTITVN